MGFCLGEDEEQTVLTAVAKDVATRLERNTRFPRASRVLPAGGQIVPHGERYFARDVLGHGFLHSAYAADYDIEAAQSVRVFSSRERTRPTRGRCSTTTLKLSGAASPPRPEPGQPETYRFRDPRRTGGDPAGFRTSGRFFWGLFATRLQADSYLDRLEAIEKKLGLIE